MLDYDVEQVSAATADGSRGGSCRSQRARKRERRLRGEAAGHPVRVAGLLPCIIH
jgi:hypothetical protein